ncbi:translational elongation factor EF-1 alpha [Basidiobolus ranarum]|uniref:Translational elongation factor EF-1 alpha n=1 Tax=Basidiobolus ranarum TaxID=34480 RepID=A0ABR2W7S7_9FUNG
MFVNYETTIEELSTGVSNIHYECENPCLDGDECATQARALDKERAALLLKKLTECEDSDGLTQVAEEVTSFVEHVGVIEAVTTFQIIDILKVTAQNKKSSIDREGALLIYASLAKKFDHAIEPYLISELPIILGGYSDKSIAVREAAQVAGATLMALPCEHAVPALLPVLFDALQNGKWQTKLGSLSLISELARTSSEQVRVCLPDIVPRVSEIMWDTKPEVQTAAKVTMRHVCDVVGNPDIEPSLNSLIGCIAAPENVPECIHQLAATTFVTQVEAPALAIMTPLLTRGLSERSPAVQRQTAVIIDNMCKLVENPADAVQFLPKLLPGLDRIIEIGSNPELRTVAERARSTLVRVGGANTSASTPVFELVESAEVLEVLKKEITKVTPSTIEVSPIALSYITTMCTGLVNRRCFDVVEWDLCIVPYLAPIILQKNADVVCSEVLKFYKEWHENGAKDAAAAAEDEEGEELCNCEFSLAYGGMILLNNTKLKLRRGQRYGLCGPNGVGKSTLMRSIAEGKLNGFPSPDELKTVFVEHNLQAEEAELGVLEFIAKDKSLSNVSSEEIKSMLLSVGFTEEMQVMAISSLSGGWKMKLELARAMLMKADILLLDEPTNHLDVTNVAWLEAYLNSLSNVTSILVSHDSGFLDNVCTNIIHYESRKLKNYKGNLSEFVKQYPEAKSYYELASVTHKFKLPTPGLLDGVKSKGKAILKMTDIGYTYPGASKQALRDISVQCSLNSRVAVLGPNGAGKSTMIKVLTGEIVPDCGEIKKHPNLRVAYVAQHAFHHVEQHLDQTPNEYIRWRYQSGEDRESLSKADRQVSEEELKQMNTVVVWDGEKLKVEGLYGRRKAGRSSEYEVQWAGKSHEDNAWVPREDLEKWGFKKMLDAYDAKEAALAGAWTRQLTAKEVEKHLSDLGLDVEFATHSRIRGLSGGQKVKVVIAAAMWLNPHLLVLDEPTNYLDRDSLGALAEAIKEFEGGVVMISHHTEFTSSLCTETWKVDAGTVTLEGNDYSTNAGEKIQAQEEAQTKLDAFGNVSKVSSKKKLSRKELKQKQKRRAQQIANGEEVSSDEDDI